MPVYGLFSRSAVTLAAIIALAACAQNGGSSLPSSLATQGNAFSHVATAVATPPPCKGQKTSSDYAQLTVTLSSKGGTFCVPAIGGFGGSISYPDATPPLKSVKITSSSTNYNNLPELGTGTAIFYLQFSSKGKTTFGSQIKIKGGLTSQAIKIGKDYTAFGQVTLGSYTEQFLPCYAIAVTGKYGGNLRTIGALLEYGVVPGPATGFIEVYSGKQTSTQC